MDESAGIDSDAPAPEWQALWRVAFSIARRWLPACDAEDVAQRSVVEAWRRWAMQQDVADIHALVCTIARRRALDRRRALRLLRSQEVSSGGHVAAAPAPDLEAECIEGFAAGLVARGDSRWVELLDLLHEALDGALPGARGMSGAEIAGWRTRLQDGYRKKKKSTPDPADSGDMQDG